MKIKEKYNLSIRDIDRIIEMAWEDRTPFDAIEHQFGPGEDEVIELMRRELKHTSWKRWRQRVQGRKSKHAKLRMEGTSRFRSSRQKHISLNRISKRG